MPITVKTEDGRTLEVLVKGPEDIWQGGQDRMVPSAHGIWLAERIPGARAHLYDGEGHISLVMQLGRVLDDLLDAAGASR